MTRLRKGREDLADVVEELRVVRALKLGLDLEALAAEYGCSVSEMLSVVRDLIAAKPASHLEGQDEARAGWLALVDETFSR